MENYSKGESRTVYDPPSLTMDGAVEMKVTNGSKIRNIMGYAMSTFAGNNIRHLIWNGTGNAINKTISCAEIMKRKIKGLHQITQIGFLKVEDFWEPTMEGLDTLKVNTNIPAISILLSKDPLDSTHPSYQPPGITDITFLDKVQRKKKVYSKDKMAVVNEIKSSVSRPKRSRGTGREGFKSASGNKKNSKERKMDSQS